jgi:hypothetical protein
MDHRVLEICYDIDAIPGRNPNNPLDPRVLRFRDGARGRIEDALFEDGLGHGIGAELDGDKLRLRFVVMDFDAAEARLTWALDETPWGPPQEVLRYWDTQAVA